MTTAELLALHTHPHKARLLSIALQIWPNLAERPDWQISWLLSAVDEVLAGLPTPTLSRRERAAIEAIEGATKAGLAQ